MTPARLSGAPKVDSRIITVSRFSLQSTIQAYAERGFQHIETIDLDKIRYTLIFSRVSYPEPSQEDIERQELEYQQRLQLTDAALIGQKELLDSLKAQGFIK